MRPPPHNHDGQPQGVPLQNTEFYLAEPIISNFCPVQSKNFLYRPDYIGLPIGGREQDPGRFRKASAQPTEEKIKNLVPRVGIEPTRCHHHRILNPARLPVPPPRHGKGRPVYQSFVVWQQIYDGSRINGKAIFRDDEN